MIRRSLFLSAAALLFSVPAMAADLIDARNPQGVFEIARGFGSAELGTDSAGDPKITGRINGTRYLVLFFGCDDGRNCKDIQFTAVWATGGSGSLDAINRWNRNKRFGKAYLDDEKDPVLEMAVNLQHGVSRANLEDTFDWWQVVLRAFEREVLQQE